LKEIKSLLSWCVNGITITKKQTWMAD